MSQDRHATAMSIYNAGLEKVATTEIPKGQKYAPGTKVMAKCWVVGEGWRPATVQYTYAHAYWGDNIRDYCLDFEGHGSVSWIDESDIKLREENEQRN